MNPGVKVTGYNTLPAMNEAAFVQTLGTIGPITAYIYVSSFPFSLYTSGIYTDYTCYGSACPASLTNHAIMLEGYGTDSTGKAYYILRNSWGTGWGNIF